MRDCCYNNLMADTTLVRVNYWAHANRTLSRTTFTSLNWADYCRTLAHSMSLFPRMAERGRECAHTFAYHIHRAHRAKTASLKLGRDMPNTHSRRHHRADVAAENGNAPASGWLQHV